MILLSPSLLFAQLGSKKFSVSGRVRVVVGTDTVAPVRTPVVRLKNTMSGVLTDSLGNYELKGLSQGKPRVNLMGFGFKADTIVEIRDRSLENIDIIAVADCEVNKAVAEKDIMDNRIRLLLTTGIVSSAETPRDENFEKRYDVVYYNYGYLCPALECVIQYNLRIFEYLDSRYGKEWRKMVRKDVWGL